MRAVCNVSSVSFDRDQVLVLVFDDFSRDPARQYVRVLEFLDLPPDSRTEFPVVNESKRHRSELLRRLIPMVPRPDALKRALGLDVIGFMAWLRRVNIKQRRRPPLSPPFRAELCCFFSCDVHLLSSLVDRDLTHWVT